MMNRFTNPAELGAQLEDLARQINVDIVDDDYDDYDDGQPDEYTEWQDFYGGDDWDHGQYDEF